MHLVARPILALTLLVLLSSAACAAEKAVHHAGVRKLDFTHEKHRRLKGYIWYPSATEAKKHDYRPQIGLAAENGAAAEGKHPLVLFSHGFLGMADQTIFLTEELARRGYIVASVHHADGLLEPKDKEFDLFPKFGDARQWSDKKFADRKDDLTALLAHLLAENERDGSYLAGRVNADAIGAAGHSLGGYTVLGMCGGWPSWKDERIKAALLLSPYTLPYPKQGKLADVKIPVMLQGGTLDFGITPLLPAVYDRLGGAKYHLVLDRENHFGWTNVASLGKTTTECIASGNPQLMTDYSIAFFDQHLRDQPRDLLTKQNERLKSYKFTEP